MAEVDTDPIDFGPDQRPLEQDIANRINRIATDPALNPEPAAGNNGAQKSRHFATADAERRSDQHRKRNPVFGAGVTNQQHRDQNDHIAQQHDTNRLHAGKTLIDQTSRQHVTGNAHHHASPQCRVMPPAPRSLSGLGRCQVLIPQGGVVLVICRHETSSVCARPPAPGDSAGTGLRLAQCFRPARSRVSFVYRFEIRIRPTDTPLLR